MKRIITFVSMLVVATTAYNQCQTGNFSGLNPTYFCPDPSQLFGVPAGGTFQGPGISGEMFSPVQAGIGSHVISYSTAPSSPVGGYIATAGMTNAPSTDPLTLVSLGDDELSAPLPIGFSFNFFGLTFTEFLISSNGFITFEVNSFDSGCCAGQNIPENFEPNNLIALAWNDLNPSAGGTIGYTTIGTAPNRILIVDFTDVPHYGGSDTISVQAKLFEATGNIEIHCTDNNGDGSPHTVGVENISGTCGITAAGMNANPDLEVINEMILFTPDAGSYYGHQTGHPMSLYTGTMTPITLANDALSAAIPLGFSFDFYGTNYTEAYVSSNGFLTFSSGGSSGCCAGASLPNAADQNNLIAFAWNNLDPSLGGTIGYTTIGTAPNRTFILDFNNIQHDGGGNPVTVQLKLLESSNLIEIHSTQNATNGTAMTMGIENTSGTEASIPVDRNASTTFNVMDERTIFYPYYTMIQITSVTSITDTEAPIPFDPFPITVEAQCGVDFLDEPFAEDNCSGFLIGTTDAVFPITETTTVVWTFVDAAGNTATTTQQVIVDDTQDPIAGGFVITITAQTWVTDEVVWSFTDGSGTVVASGGPYLGGDGPGEVLDMVNVNGTNGPYSFMGTTAGNWNDNVFSYTVKCEGATLASGTVNAGQTNTSNNIAECDPFADIVSYCDLTSIPSKSASDNCEGTVAGTHNAVFPITANTTVTWTFNDGNGNVTTVTQDIIINSMDLTVNTVGNSFVAAQTGPGVTYSWVDCNNNFAPLGVTTQAFTPTQGGSYAVVITIGGCSKTSSCVTSNVGLDENELNLFLVYPNPAEDVVMINSITEGSIEILDLSGKVIRQNAVSIGINQLHMTDLSSGTYTLRMISNSGVQNKRLVIAKK